MGHFLGYLWIFGKEIVGQILNLVQQFLAHSGASWKQG